MAGSDADAATDGGVTKEDIFGTGESTGRVTEPASERLKRLFDIYVRAPLSIAWSDWRTRIGGILLLFYVFMGTVGVWLVEPTSPNEGPIYVGPFENMAYPLGTDYIGQGIFELTVHATPGMLLMVVSAIAIAVGWGSLVGFVSGYKGGTVDRVLMTITDTTLVIPRLPLIVVLVSIYPPRDPYLVGAMISLTYWAPLARQLRSQVLTIREEDFVEAARAMGLGTPTIIGQEIAPKMAPYILIRGATTARGVIFTSVALYFIGVLPIGAFSNWGTIMNYAYMENAHLLLWERGHWLLVPVLALAGLTFGLVLLSQGLDRVFNPRLRARHAKTVTDEEGME